MISTTLARDLHNTIVKELKNTKLADAIVEYNEFYLEELRRELDKRWNDVRQQNKYELRDELTKELSTKADLENTRIALKADSEQVRSELRADIEQVRSELKADIEQVRSELKADIEQVRSELKQLRTELKADIKLTNLKMMFQTAIIVLVILATTPGGITLIEKIFPFLR